MRGLFSDCADLDCADLRVAVLEVLCRLTGTTLPTTYAPRLYRYQAACSARPSSVVVPFPKLVRRTGSLVNHRESRALGHGPQSNEPRKEILRYLHRASVLLISRSFRFSTASGALPGPMSQVGR